MSDKELTSVCTCPDRAVARVRNITGHAPECPCYAEWYARYAPKDAGAYIPPVNAPDQVGPFDLAVAEGMLGTNLPTHRGADWLVPAADSEGPNLASVKAAMIPEDEDGQP